MGRFSRMVYVACLVGTGSVASADPGAFRGPYLNDVTTDAITVLWESPNDTTGVVHYGVNSPNEHSAASTTPGKHHEVRLTGLEGLAAPGSRFVYELEVAGVRYPGRFFTAVQGDAPFTFLAYGDNRSSETQHQAVVDAIMREMIDVRFIMSTGDMVSDGDNEGHWDTFFGIEAPFLARAPVYLAIGNHEVDSNRWRIGQRVFAHPTTVPPASNDEAFYHFIYGNAQFIVINAETDNLFTGALSVLGGDQVDWLEDVLAMRPAGVRHRFVFIHKGPYSSKPGRNGNFWLRQWLDAFKDAGVNLVVSGHDHYAERGWAKNGLPYVIHGGGGAPLYDTYGPRVVSDHTIVYGESRLGYLLVSIDGPKATVTLKALDGSVVDTFGWGDTVNPQCQSATDCGAPPAFPCPGGEWECANNACNYTCGSGSGVVACATDRACENALGATCPGDAVCERPSLNPLEWYCRCDIPPECTEDSDCANRPPPVPGCVGTWACPDEVCEFSPQTTCEEDAGVTTPDAGPPDATADDAAAPDASAPDASQVADAAAEDATDPTTPDAGTAEDATAAFDDAAADPLPFDAGTAPPTTTDDEGCGCTATPERSTRDWSALWGGVLLLLALRRKRND